MEKTEKSQRGCKQQETDLLLQWGNGKRLRCVRVRDPEISDPSYVGVGAGRRKMTSRLVAFSEKETCSFQPCIRVGRNSETGRLNRRVSPEKERRDCEEEESEKVWPKLYIGLSIKEKEEDFMAMKGCKLPHRPKKRAKIIQRSLLLVSPGAWLTDMCQERYEVREKKSSKKIHRPRGLKAMGNMESDSE